MQVLILTHKQSTFVLPTVTAALLKLCYFILSDRSQGSHGFCSGYTRYRYLLPPNDVLNNSAHRVLHCVDCWWRYNPHAVMAEHQVSVQLCAGENSLFNRQLC